MHNKTVDRDTDSSTRIFDQRSLERDYATLTSALRKGMHVLDVGCGTGAISKGIAEYVGPDGYVIAIDNTEAFITSGKELYSDVSNLELSHNDLFTFETEEKFDLVVAARVLQWMSNPQDALKRLTSFLKPGGVLSILDYNHEALEWIPEPPESMRRFYGAFLGWRSHAGMDNQMAENLSHYFANLGMKSIEVINADEVYEKGQVDFAERAGIWSKVAGLRQIVEEGFITEEARLQAIYEYDRWVQHDGERMILKLKEVRGNI